jgi:cytoskeletal protein RodZ
MRAVVSSARSNAMTIGDEAEIRRTSVSTKVLMVGCGVLAVLGSFWSIVWFIRTYVEAPRVTLAPTIALAARDSAPVAPPKPAVAPAPASTAATQAAASPPAVIMTETTPTGTIRPAEAPPVSGGRISDRWMPVTPSAPAQAEPTPAAVSQTTTPAALPTTPPDNDQAADEVAESAVPAITGTAPLPRRKPTQIAAIKPRTAEPPLPRPRPDGPAPQSVWTAVPTTDDRFPQQ